MISQRERDPTNEELAAALDLTVEEVTEALDAICPPVSLYDPVYAEGGDPLTIMDQVKDNRNTEGVWIDQICLQAAFHAQSLRGSPQLRRVTLPGVHPRTAMEVIRDPAILVQPGTGLKDYSSCRSCGFG